MKKYFALLFALAIALGLLFTVTKDVLVNVALAKRPATSQAGGVPTPPPIVSISVCQTDSLNGNLPQGSCSPGLFDSHQIVRGPDGGSINNYVHGGVSDEHQSVFPPGTLDNNPDYLFFVASRTRLNDDTGMLVLSGVPTKEPDSKGQWTLDFAKDYGYYPTASPCATPSVSPAPSIAPYAPVFLSPSGSGCPIVNDGEASPDPAHQDQTFDLNYAAPGSIVLDTTTGGGNLLMIYEGTNTCFGAAGGLRGNGFYSSVAVATSLDYGKTWPTYHDTSSFAFVPLPCQNTTAGPNPWGVPTPTPIGAMGPGKVYEGNDTQSTPPLNYGRYAILMPSVSIATAMATGKVLPGDGSIGDAEMAALLDDVKGDPLPYLYVIYNNNLNPLSDDKETGGMTMARARLNGGSAPLSFAKWYQPSPTPGSSPSPGSWVPNSGIGGYDTPIFAKGGLGYNCEGAGEQRFGGSLSYVEATHQYLLTFVCTSAEDPATYCDPSDPNCLQDPTAKRTGAAWFYSTNYDLSDPTQWTPPQEIAGSWSDFEFAPAPSPSPGASPDPPCPSYKGYYPTFVSLNNNPARLAPSGYVFYLYGCQTADANRKYSSRAFKITTTDTTPPVTTADVAGPLGANGWYTGPTTVSFTATDDLSGVATTQFSLDGGQHWTTGNSLSLTSKGIYNILYRSIDVDENTETAKSITVEVDSNGPVTTAAVTGLAGLNGWFTGSTTVNFAATDDLSGVAQTEYSQDDGQTWTAGTSVTLTTSSIYNLLYRSTDVAGNVETPKSITVMLDANPPVISETASPSIIFNDVRVVPVTISGTIKDSPSGVDPSTAKYVVHDEYGRIHLSGPITVNPNGSYSFTVHLRTFVKLNDTDGRLYTIRVRAADNAGNSRTTETTVTAKRQRTPPCKPHCI